MSPQANDDQQSSAPQFDPQQSPAPQVTVGTPDIAATPEVVSIQPPTEPAAPEEITQDISTPQPEQAPEELPVSEQSPQPAMVNESPTPSNPVQQPDIENTTPSTSENAEVPPKGVEPEAQTETPTPPVLSVESDEPEKPKKAPPIKLILLIVSILFVVFTMVIIIASFLSARKTSAAEKASNNLMRAITDNKPNDVYNLTSTSYHFSATQENVRTNVAQLSSDIKNGKYEIADRQIITVPGNSDKASIVYKVKPKDHDPFYIRIVLEKENGTWKADTIQQAQTKLSAQDI